MPALTWLYIAMAQFPVYLLPHLLKPVLARLGAAQVSPREAGSYDRGREL